MTPTKFGMYAVGLRALTELNKTLTHPIDMPPAGALDVGSYVLRVSGVAPAISFVDLDFIGLSTPGTFSERVYYDSGEEYIYAIAAAGNTAVSSESDLRRLIGTVVRARIDWSVGYRIHHSPLGFSATVDDVEIVPPKQYLAVCERAARALGYDKSILTIIEFDSVLPSM